MGKIIQLQQCTVKMPNYGYDGELLRKCVEDNMMCQLKRALGELKWEDIVTVKEDDTLYTYSIRMEITTGKD